MTLTQGDGGDFVVDRKNCDIEIINRKCAVERNRWGRGFPVAAAVRPSGLAVGDDEGDCVEHRRGSDLPALNRTRAPQQRFPKSCFRFIVVKFSFSTFVCLKALQSAPELY